MTRRAGAAATGVLAALGLVVAGQSFAADASSGSANAADRRLQPSGEGLPFEPGRYRDFGDYVRQTRERLERHKVYMDPQRAGLELAAATPFERAPAASCPPAAGERPSRGVLLLHGLSDMPLAMRDLADAFAARCFMVRAMLLPGHGTRAGDLLDVTRGDWLAATRFGLKTLQEDVEEVFVGGFSLGGLLSVHAVHAVLEDATVRGAFVFSPALALGRAWLVRQSVYISGDGQYIVEHEPNGANRRLPLTPCPEVARDSPRARRHHRRERSGEDHVGLTPPHTASARVLQRRRHCGGAGRCEQCEVSDAGAGPWDAQVAKQLDLGDSFEFESTWSGRSRPEVVRDASARGYNTRGIFLGMDAGASSNPETHRRRGGARGVIW